jgi:hypothetical protein
MTEIRRVQFQDLLHPKCKGWKATSHVGIARRNPHPHIWTGWKRDHRSVSSPRMIRSSASTSTSLSTITRLPFNATTSMQPSFDAALALPANGSVATTANPSSAGPRSQATQARLAYESEVSGVNPTVAVLPPNHGDEH